MGHMHGDRLADLPFPRDVGKKLIAEGKASPHHVLPQSGWISYYIKGIEDIPGTIELFQMQYERMISYGKRRTTKNQDSMKLESELKHSHLWERQSEGHYTL
jgi:hypothetical protein